MIIADKLRQSVSVFWRMGLGNLFYVYCRLALTLYLFTIYLFYLFTTFITD